jgi:uncharacterized protein YaeQ
VALTATLFRFEVELSDVDRNVYEQLELRAAQHPSETTRYLLARVLAYCLCYEEGIAFSRGLAVADEPAVWIKDLQGNTRAWIEVGTPSSERLHKASKAVPRVAVFTHHDAEALKKAVRGQRVHRVEQIELYAIDPAFLDQLAAQLDRSNRWTIARNDAEIYATVKDETITTRLERHTLGDAQ